MADHDLRLIEDYLPIAEISAEASREKSVRKGHISTLHLWWARRPLVACRAAVYGALVPADRWVKAGSLNVKNAPEGDEARVEAWKKATVRGLNRKQAKDFVAGLCRYPSDSKPAEKAHIEKHIEAARGHILEAHAERLTAELTEAKQTGKPPAWVTEFKWSGDKVAAKDIEAGRAPRPRVLDMFAGGGAIPLEALRLGCEAYALDLNPVAHIIQLCTLVYPQKYGKADATARGMTGPKNSKGEPTWGGLADEVRYWGNWVLEKVRAEIGDLYPLIPDPDYKPTKTSKSEKKGTPVEPAKGKGKGKLFNGDMEDDDEESASIDVPPGFLMPVAYLWTRVVKCKNPSCGAAVPLFRQTWLCKKSGRYVALQPIPDHKNKRLKFKVVESATETGLGFSPEGFSSAGNAPCRFCGTIAESDFVKEEGCAGRIHYQLMAVACTRPRHKGKVYLAADHSSLVGLNEDLVRTRLDTLCSESGLSIPTEPIVTDAKNANFCILYGMRRFADLFTPRQLLCLLSFAQQVRRIEQEFSHFGDPDRAKAVCTLLAAILDRLADFNSTLCIFNYTGGRGVVHTFGRQALPMVWDFAESNPFNPAGASWISGVEDLPAGLRDATSGRAADVRRGSATELPWPPELFDAVITDPPYYDNVPYADISDFFYVWLRRTVGHLYPEHFATEGTPKKKEAVADAVRHEGNRDKANRAYEEMMKQSFRSAGLRLKPGGHLIVVYAHKTTLGWSTLVEGMRQAGFTVTEAWPLDTEKTGRLRAQDSAALATSIFLVARKRVVGAGVGNYEDDVQPELEAIIRERVATLWDMGITGADLVIACVGAGLRAFTRFEKVEYASGEPVAAEKFLAEVEAVVLDTLMAKLLAGTRAAVLKTTGADEEPEDRSQQVGGIDPISRFYVLWRYLYKAAEMEAGEAIVFANGLHVELDGAGGLCDGKDAVLEKKKSKYRLRDFTERGKIEAAGLPNEAGQPAPLIDVLHRLLYLMEHRPNGIREFLDKARPNRERLRLLAASLAGPGLSGKSEEDASRLVATTAAEQSALGKLLANWKNLVPESLFAGGGPGGLYEGKK
jgi:putative DNA methylase